MTNQAALLPDMSIQAKVVVVVIVTYNSEKHIQNLLTRLSQQTLSPAKIIIVDNDSQDTTCNIIKQIQSLDDRVVLYQLTENLGGAGGFAHGLKYALSFDPDFIITFDDDAFPQGQNFLEDMVSFQQQHGHQVVCPLVADSQNPKKTAYEYHCYGGKQTEVASIQKISDIIHDIKLFNGSMFLPEVIAHLKGPNPKFFIRGDEAEFKQRILQSGYQVAINPQCVVYHPTSLHEYVYLKGRRYQYFDSPFKLFFATRNRYYMFARRSDLLCRQKMLILCKEFWRYTWFYLVYRQGDIKNYYIWLKALVFGLLGYFNNQAHVKESKCH